MRQTKDTKLIPIGNSQGIRISKLLLQKYGFIDRLVLEETDKGILIRKPDEDSQFSWEDTFKAMAQEEEDWSDLDVTLMDGLAKMTPERYEIYFADLNPTSGREINKVRPVVIVSQNEMNRYLDTVVVCPHFEPASSMAKSHSDSVCRQRCGDRH